MYFVEINLYCCKMETQLWVLAMLPEGPPPKPSKSTLFSFSTAQKIQILASLKASLNIDKFHNCAQSFPY